MYVSHCIKRAKPLLVSLCFVHQVELCPDDFNLLFTFSKARTASKYLQKNNSPFLVFISMRLFLCPEIAVPFEKCFSDRNWGVSVPQGSPCRDTSFGRVVVVSFQLPFRGSAGVTEGLKVVQPGYAGEFAA